MELYNADLSAIQTIAATNFKNITHSVSKTKTIQMTQVLS